MGHYTWSFSHCISTLLSVRFMLWRVCPALQLHQQLPSVGSEASVLVGVPSSCPLPVSQHRHHLPTFWLKLRCCICCCVESGFISCVHRMLSVFLCCGLAQTAVHSSVSRIIFRLIKWLYSHSWSEKKMFDHLLPLVEQNYHISPFANTYSWRAYNHHHHASYGLFISIPISVEE